MEEKINLAIAIVVSGPQRNPLLLSRACQVIFGKIGTIHGRRVVPTDHRKGAFVAFAPQHVRCCQTSSTSANDDNRAWSVRYSLRDGWRDSLTNKDLVANFFNPPTRDWVKRRRPERLAGPQTETRMVPGAAHGVPDHQPVSERPAVVRA